MPKNNALRILLSILLCAALSASPLLADDPAPDEEYLGDVEEVWDPLEPFNRGVFWFNDKFDRFLLEPVAKGYDWIMPDRAQDMVSNVFSNIAYPSRLVSSVLQLKFGQAATETGRFVVNSTVGVVGLFDVADGWGMEKHSEDIASAMHYHGVPAGPYLVLPILGPSNFRDGIGLVGDILLDPAYWIPPETASSGDATRISLGIASLYTVNRRAELVDAVDTAREAAVDEYLFLQGAYYQHRAGVTFDGRARPLSEVDGSGDDGFMDDDFDQFGDEEAASDQNALIEIDDREKRASLSPELSGDLHFNSGIDLNTYLISLDL